MNAEEPRPLSLARAALWVLGVFWLLRLSMAWAVQLFPDVRSDAVSLGAIELLVLGAGCSLMALAYRPKVLGQGVSSDFFKLLGARRFYWWWGALGVGLGLAMKFPAGALQALIETRWPSPSEQLAAQALLLRHDTLGQVLALVVVIGFLGPAIEELFYRGVLFQLLKDSRGASVATSFVAIAFTFVHPLPRSWPALLLLSAVLTYLRLRSDSIWASLGAHTAFNCATLLTVISGWSYFDSASSLPTLTLLGSLIAGALLVLVRWASYRHGRIE